MHGNCVAGTHDRMFRHTTKQRAANQGTLKDSALKALEKQADDKHDNYEAVSYGIVLPWGSRALLNPILSGLCENCEGTDGSRRRLHTVGVWVSSACEVVRLCFVEPDVVTCTAKLSMEHYTMLAASVGKVQAMCNGAKACGVVPHTNVCQVMGRMTPYLIEYCGLTGEVMEWSHLNATGTRMVVSRTQGGSTAYYSFTAASIELLRPYAEPDGVFVKLTNGTSFKLTCSPKGVSTDAPNKNTCIIFQSDGSFRVQGLPRATGAVCRTFRTCVDKVSESAVWGLFLESLKSLETE